MREHNWPKHMSALDTGSLVSHRSDESFVDDSGGPRAAVPAGAVQRAEMCLVWPVMPLNQVTLFIHVMNRSIAK